jgi:hypothetical protein
MPTSLKIEIESDDEKNLFSLLEHITKEIRSSNNVEDCYVNRDLEHNYYVENGWLVVREGPFKGRYKWDKI